MAPATTNKFTEAQYLAIERETHSRSEFCNGAMIAMPENSRDHNVIQENLSIEVGGRLHGSGCRALPADQRLKIECTGLYTYPDLLIVSGKGRFDSQQCDNLLNPQVIFEIVSDASERYDRGVKFLHYRRLPSLREYVLVSQKRVLIERLVRQSDDTWLFKIFNDPAGEFALASVPVRVPLADVYRDVEPLDLNMTLIPYSQSSSRDHYSRASNQSAAEFLGDRITLQVAQGKPRQEAVIGQAADARAQSVIRQG